MRHSPAASSSDDPTAADLLSRAVAALGGEERLTAVDGWVREGTLEIQGLAGTYKEWAGKPDRLKYDVDLRIAHVVRGFDGHEGWEQRGDTVRALSGGAYEALKRRALFLPVFAWYRRGVEAQVVGRETAGEREAWVVEVRREGSRPERIWLDGATFLPESADSLPIDEDG